MLLWVMAVGFENTCTVSGKSDISRVVPGLSGWVYKIFKTPQLLVELWVSSQGYSHSASSQSVIIIAGSQLGEFQFECYG